ncbi:hypothetical protein LFM09_09040 [Lentzea alba]|uniref:hypothetical protein n=1 Tax=Lentzea alba TaxID=2714351 RepID=UPI0039BF8CC1
MRADATDALVTTTGLLIVLEDLHRADRTSLRLLAHLAGELATARILVIATYRDTVSDVLPDLLRTVDPRGPAGVTARRPEVHRGLKRTGTASTRTSPR